MGTIAHWDASDFMQDAREDLDERQLMATSLFFTMDV